jgi:hypothetical protein
MAHTLVMIPPKSLFPLRGGRSQWVFKVAFGQRPNAGPIAGRSAEVMAGDGDRSLILVCGYFHATYGGSADLFEGLREPVAEQLSAQDDLDAKLQAALTELVSQEIGGGAMSAALLKQVIVLLQRRCLVSMKRVGRALLRTGRSAGCAGLCRYGHAPGRRPLAPEPCGRRVP